KLTRPSYQGVWRSNVEDMTVRPPTWVAALSKANALELLNADTGEPIGPVIETADPISNVVISVPAGRLITTTTRTIKKVDGTDRAFPTYEYESMLWDARTGRAKLEQPIRVGPTTPGPFCGKDDRYFVVAYADGPFQW